MAMNVFEGARRIAKLLAALWVVGWVIAAFYVSPSVEVTYKIATPGAAPIKITEACPADSTTEHVYDKATQSGTKTVVTLCFPPFRVAGRSRSSAEITMSTFKVKAPDGSIILVNAPVGATEQQAIEFAATTWKPQPSLLEGLPDAPISKEEELEFSLRLEKEQAAPHIDKSKVKWDDESQGQAAPKEAQPMLNPQGVTPRVEANPFDRFDVDFDLLAEKEAFVLPQSDEKWIDRQWWPLFMKEIGWGALGAVSGLLFLLAFTWTTGWIVRGFMGVPRGQDHKENREIK